MVTTTVHVAVKLPSWVVTVMVALPAVLPAVTKPLLLTVATLVLLEDQDTALLDASDGLTVSTS